MNVHQGARPRQAILTLKRRFYVVETGRFTVAALTNNFAPPTEVSASAEGGGGKAPSLDEELQHLGLGSSQEQLRKLFDFYIESAVVGKRCVRSLLQTLQEPTLTH
jgi:hypothetical protein